MRGCCSLGWYVHNVSTVNREAATETAKLFMSGNSQAMRLPKSYRFSWNEVVIKRLGNAVIVLPKEA